MSLRINGLWTGICRLLSKGRDQNGIQLIYIIKLVTALNFLTNCLV